MLLARGLRRRGGALDLGAGGHEGRPVLERPAVILHVGDLQTVGPETPRQRDDFLEMIEILAMHDGVHG